MADTRKSRRRAAEAVEAVEPPARNTDPIRPLDLHACCVELIHAQGVRGRTGDEVACPECHTQARFVDGAWQAAGRVPFAARPFRGGLD